MEPNPQQATAPAQEERTSLLESWKALHEEARALIRAELDDLAERHVEERITEAATIEADRDAWLSEQLAPLTAREPVGLGKGPQAGTADSSARSRA